MAPRRSKIELIRDLLLSVAMAPEQKEKPTRIMYAIGSSWRTLMGRDTNPERGWVEEEGLLSLVVRKGLIENVGPGMTESKSSRPSTRRDKRTPSIYAITDRGLLVLRLMDLLWVYLEGDSPQVRIPPAILRILARATNFGESLEGLVQNVVYAPRLASVDMEKAMDNLLLDDMKDDSLVISEAAPDRDRLSQALDLVADDAVKRIEPEKQTYILSSSVGLAQAVNEMPAEFFVNAVVEGIEDLEEATGEPGMPVQVESTFKVLEEAIIDESTRTEADGLKCPLCWNRVFSPTKHQWRATMKAHFKKKHPDHTPVFQ